MKLVKLRLRILMVRLICSAHPVLTFSGTRSSRFGRGARGNRRAVATALSVQRGSAHHLWRALGCSYSMLYGVGTMIGPAKLSHTLKSISNARLLPDFRANLGPHQHSMPTLKMIWSAWRGSAEVASKWPKQPQVVSLWQLHGATPAPTN